jgi:hypothetical protein
MPLSNCIRFSYALTSAGFRETSAWKSRRLNNVALQSLHSLTSTLIKFAVADFSEALEMLDIKLYGGTELEAHEARCSIQSHWSSQYSDHRRQPAHKSCNDVSERSSQRSPVDRRGIEKHSHRPAN